MFVIITIVKSLPNLHQIFVKSQKHNHSPTLIQEMLVHLKIGSSASSPIWGKLNRNGKLSKKLLNYSDWNWQLFCNICQWVKPHSNLKSHGLLNLLEGSYLQRLSMKNAFAAIFLLGWTKPTTFQKRRKELRDKEKKDSKYRRGTVQLDPVSCPPRLIISFSIKITGI